MLEATFKISSQSIFDYICTLVCLIFFQKLFFTVRQSIFQIDSSNLEDSLVTESGKRI